MMCTTVLHGGVCHRASTPHKSGNTMNEKKKTRNIWLQITYIELFYTKAIKQVSNERSRRTRVEHSNKDTSS